MTPLHFHVVRLHRRQWWFYNFLNGHRRASVLVVLPFSCPRFSFLTICCFYLFTAILVGKGIFIHLFFVKLQILHEIMKCCYQIATKAKRMKREKQHMYKSLNGGRKMDFNYYWRICGPVKINCKPLPPPCSWTTGSVMTSQILLNFKNLQISNRRS